MNLTIAKLARVERAYLYWAETSVEAFNKNQGLRPRMVGMRFLPNDRLDCIFIDDAYVQQMLATPGGDVELGRFARSLLVETELRSDMVKKGYKNVDAVAFIAQIEVQPTQPGLSVVSEAILIAFHTSFGIRRGFCPIAKGKNLNATIGPLEPL